MLDLIHARRPAVLSEQTESLYSEMPDDVVEVPFLLSTEQLVALEKAAHSQGLTAAEMVRRLLDRYVTSQLA